MVNKKMMMLRRSVLPFSWLFLMILICSSQASEEKVSVGIYNLKKGDLQANFTNWGATIVSVVLPDAHGILADVALGYDKLTQYMEVRPTRPYFGAVLGRVSNRIKDGTFKLYGKTYHTSINDGNNTLHGGTRGFDNVLWKVAEYKPSNPQPYVRFVYQSHDGEQGFPGNLYVSLKYIITSKMELILQFKAVPVKKASPVSLTTHAYWNLAGHNSGRKITDNIVRIWASHYTPADMHLIPTGQILPVAGTALDFRKPITVGSVIDKVKSYEHPPGFDNNYVLDGPILSKKNGIKPAALMVDPFSKRAMTVWTNAPGMQFYTSNNLKNEVGKRGFIYKPHTALCFEPQGFPNSVNQPNFPSVIVNPGQVYSNTIIFRFSIIKKKKKLN